MASALQSPTLPVGGTQQQSKPEKKPSPELGNDFLQALTVLVVAQASSNLAQVAGLNDLLQAITGMGQKPSVADSANNGKSQCPFFYNLIQIEDDGFLRSPSPA